MNIIQHLAREQRAILKRLEAIEAMLSVEIPADSGSNSAPSRKITRYRGRQPTVTDEERKEIVAAYLDTMQRHPTWTGFRICRKVGRDLKRSVTTIATITKKEGLYVYAQGQRQHDREAD